MNNKHLSWYEEINNNFIIASRAHFLQKSDKSSMLVHHEKSAVCDGYIVEYIHDVYYSC